MNKKNLILAGILLFLVLVSYLYQGPMQDWKANFNKQENFLQSVNMDDVNTIELIREGETTRLVKNGDRWRIDGTKDFYVRDDVMGEVISSLQSAKEAEIELVSENLEKKSDFQVDESGNRVKLMNGENVLVDFVVGKVTTDYKGSFVSMPDFPKTYALESSLNSLDRGSWYDTTIFKEDKEKINKIRFQYPTREFTVEKGEKGWAGVLPYKFAVSDEKIEKILNVMTSLNAIKIPEQTFDGTGLEKHNIIVELSGEDGINYSIMIGDANDEDQYFAKKGDSDNIYLIKKEERDELNKQAWELK